MPQHYLIYGHGGSYNHGAEALVRTTIPLLRRLSPGCRVTLSTHFAAQDMEFGLDADEFVERDPDGGTDLEVYAPTIERIGADTVCLHSGGDNYCYPNWRRWAAIHYAALERGAGSVLWGCSIEPGMIDDEMLAALRSHDLITAREGLTYDALLAHGLDNVVKVTDIAFTLAAEPCDFVLENYVVLNVSPLVIRLNPCVDAAFRMLIDHILAETDMNVALLPHVVQPVDNDHEALSALAKGYTGRVRLVSDKLSAGQYKSIIGKARFCVAARTHAVIAAYSSCVPALAVGYSVKSAGLARDLGMEEYVVATGDVRDGTELVTAFQVMMKDEAAIAAGLAGRMPVYVGNVVNEGVLSSVILAKK